MTSWRYQLIILVLLVAEATLQSDIILSQSSTISLENSTITLTCSNETGTLEVALWYSSMFPGIMAVCGRQGDTCIKTNFLNSSLYDCTCNDNGTISVFLRHVNRTQHGTIWICETIGRMKSNDIKIEVLVPVTNVVLHQSSSRQIIENSSTTFQCNTSYSLPPATVYWYRSKDSTTVELSNSTGGDVLITRKQYTRNDHVTSVEETLTYKVNRSVHGWNFYCVASNRGSYSTYSEVILLSITYPPEYPPVIQNFTNGSIYKVIDDKTASLSCSVEGGNPLARPKWVCINLIKNSTEVVIDNTKVTSNLSWTASRDQGKTCRCQTDHILSNSFTFVNFDVLYPPSVLTLQLQYQGNVEHVVADVKLIESKTYSLKCSADGNPPPKKFTWSGPHNLTVSSNGSLDFSKVQRVEDGIYSCMAQNIMSPTYGDNKTGNKSMSVQIDILYQPTVAKLMNCDVAEGSSVNITCNVRSSNPNITDVVWTRDKNDFEIHSNPLILRSISRHDSMNYTCTMKNKMTPTVGDKEEGQDRESFHLTVWYKASVRIFLVLGHEHENPFVANETTTIVFNCEIDSNPGSITTIVSPNGTQLWSVGSNNLSYSHVLSSCHDTGTYTCSGINEYNHGRPGNASLSLIVNCKPMAQSPVKEDIRSALFVPVTLQFAAVAYPEPEFTWQLWANSLWNKLENNNVFSILSSDMKSNLTVRNFSSTQAMLFRLVVENVMGRLTQNYILQPFDSPDKPLEFRHVVKYLTDTTVMLSWRPGFNGGLPQNFTVMHNRETDQEWNTSVFPDTGQDLMNYTIRGLYSSTVYVFRIYAENMKNRSDILEIKITTKVPVVDQAPPNIGQAVNIVIGCIVSILAIVVTTMLIVFGCRRYKMKKKDHGRTNGVTSYENMTTIQAVTEEEVFETKETIYEKLKGEKDRGSHEKMELTYETLNQDRDDVKSTNPVYANLKL